MSKLAESIPPGVLAGALRFVFGLPAPLRRLIAGRPITVDGQRLHPEAQLLLRLQQLSGEDWRTTTPAANRLAMTRSTTLVGGPVIGGVAVRSLSLDGVGARFYEPHGLAAGSPLLVFYHGGGWVSGDLDSHDNLCRFLAVESGVRVLSRTTGSRRSTRSRPRRTTRGPRSSTRWRTPRSCGSTRGGSRWAVTARAGTWRP
jgi:acetyl esterase